MKLTIFVFLAGVLLGVARLACADCASELTVHAVEPEQPLPPACRAMGPLHLGMSRAAMLAVMGTPDNANVPEPEPDMSVVYVFPRDLRVRLREHPVHRAAFDNSLAFIVVTLHAGKVAMIHAFDDGVPPSIPYTVGGIALQEDVSALLSKVAVTPLWNRPKDSVGLYPYPLRVGVDTDSNRVMGMSISINDNISGDWPAFQWIIDPTTGLVGGYRVFFRDFPRHRSAADSGGS